MSSDKAPVIIHGRNSGSLTLTVREGSEISVVTESGEHVTLYVASLSAKRASVNVRAPRSWPILHHRPSDE
jgi:hypothetical protein